MSNKKRKLKIIITLLISILLLHQAFHFIYFGTGISGFYEQGVSGFAIKENPTNEDSKSKAQSISPISKIILIVEWTFLIALTAITITRNRRETEDELKGTKSPKKYKKSGNSTDLDALYNLLKEKKHLRISTIARAFKIDNDLAKEWSQTLESAGLVSISYPKFGQPEVVLNEEEN